MKDFNQKTEPWQGYNFEPSKTSLDSHPSIKAEKAKNKVSLKLDNIFQDKNSDRMNGCFLVKHITPKPKDSGDMTQIGASSFRPNISNNANNSALKYFN